eukprot:Polyplicarium_translucidae@DN3091_c0_g1_i1.p1
MLGGSGAAPFHQRVGPFLSPSEHGLLAADAAMLGSGALLYGATKVEDGVHSGIPSDSDELDLCHKHPRSRAAVVDWVQPCLADQGYSSNESSTTSASKSRIAQSRKILVRVRVMWLQSIPEGRQRDIAYFILDKHGNQMPYDRQYWSNAYKSNKLTDRDDITRTNLDRGVETLKKFVIQVEKAGDILRSFTTDPERARQIPSDLTDDYLMQWLSGPNAVLIRGLLNNGYEVRDVHLPACLNSDNLGRALAHGGLLVRLPPHSQKNFDYFNLLSPGRGDTRHTELSIPDGGVGIDVKKSRTHLAFPPNFFPDTIPLPKVCVFQIDAKLELLLFYRGNSQKRPKRGFMPFEAPYVNGFVPLEAPGEIFDLPPSRRRRTPFPEDSCGMPMFASVGAGPPCGMAPEGQNGDARGEADQLEEDQVHRGLHWAPAPHPVDPFRTADMLVHAAQGT